MSVSFQSMVLGLALIFSLIIESFESVFDHLSSIQETTTKSIFHLEGLSFYLKLMNDEEPMILSSSQSPV